MKKISKVQTCIDFLVQSNTKKNDEEEEEERIESKRHVKLYIKI